MSGTYSVVMGDRGRLVVPVELRERLGVRAGSTLMLIETPDGVVLATREQVRRLVKAQLQGPSLVAELLSERRAAAALENQP